MKKYGNRIRLDINEFTLEEFTIMASAIRFQTGCQSGKIIDTYAKLLTKLNRIVEVLEKKPSGKGVKE